MREAVLYKKLENGGVRCGACRHACVIASGRAGICGVRQNIDGRLYLLVYGRASAVNIDPVEKKPLFHFLPGSSIFSLGTVGCNFGCDFCQNWDISQATRGLAQSLAKEKKLKDMLDRKERLEYNINNLESPERLERVLLSKNINIGFPGRHNVVKVAGLTRATEERLRASSIDQKFNLFGIADFLSPRAEAQVKER